MPFVLVRIKVEDFGRWKRLMDEHVAKRKELGSRGTQVFRESAHPDHVVCLTEWSNEVGAREFMAWGDPAEIRRRAGAVGPAEATFLDRVDSLEA